MLKKRSSQKVHRNVLEVSIRFTGTVSVILVWLPDQMKYLRFIDFFPRLNILEGLSRF